MFALLYPSSPKWEGGILFTSVRPSDIWSQASYRYTILWVAFLDPSDSYFLFADFVGFYTHWTYMHIFRHIFLSNYWWQWSDIWSQASYRYPILWEAFFDPSDSYFLFAEGQGYHRWALAHSSSCWYCLHIVPSVGQHILTENHFQLLKHCRKVRREILSAVMKLLEEEKANDLLQVIDLLVFNTNFSSSSPM